MMDYNNTWKVTIPFIQHITKEKKNYNSLFLLFEVRPRATTHPLSSSNFILANLHTYKCEGSRIRRLGAYGLPRTSPQRY
ncbi:hypothetical protein HanXRQr2_Chr13g0574641 [Helianthus annuus]|uniref:Uncharacterized protein n=1 Tax=Helianthus annuus TaxID=4232 RepID=A0A9K3EFS8_HELAN|nr:hypothetical protein HanXRQr2_Chr13g0574641 [Helianthus annuus]KAJ0848097.1 hypothetical protein HanPSC8_Chr13g0553161 [Helianthus annuus]